MAIKIADKLEAGAGDGVLTDTAQIKDGPLSKTQEEINNHVVNGEVLINGEWVPPIKDKSYTLDFGTAGEIIQDINLEGAITINRIVKSNVVSLKVSYGSVLQQEITDADLPIEIADGLTLTWEIVREAEGQPACVGIKFVK